MKPPIYKFPLTLQSALRLLFSPSFECVLRYSALFIKGAKPNELLTWARLSISSLKECFIISRLLAFLGCGIAINSSGSVRTPPYPSPSTHSPSPHLHFVMCESRTVSSAVPVRLDNTDSVWVKGRLSTAAWRAVMTDRPRKTASMWWVELGEIGGESEIMRE